MRVYLEKRFDIFTKYNGEIVSHPFYKTRTELHDCSEITS